MISLIYGGSGSGKSAYAEQRVMELGNQRYYLATMQVYDAEGEQKVQRHRKLRKSKGFVTVERPRDIKGAIDNQQATVLLECMSNLVANEMFCEDTICSVDDVVEKIMDGVKEIAHHTKHLVIVSNNVFEDGIIYDDATMHYIQAFGIINQRIAALADEVIEVVVGIPVVQKRKENHG